MSEAPLPEHSLKSGLTASRAQHVESAVPAPVAVDEKADQGVIRHYEVSFGPASGSKSLAVSVPIRLFGDLALMIGSHRLRVLLLRKPLLPQ